VFVRSTADRTRSRHLFIADVVGSIGAALVAFMAWQDALLTVEGLVPYLWIVGILVATRVAVDVSLGLYRHSWRYASVGDMALILLCAAVGSAAAFVIVAATWLARPVTGAEFPGMAFWLVEGTITLLGIAVTRFSIRAASDLRIPHAVASGASTRRRTLLYGAGWAGVTMVRSLNRGRPGGIRPVGFLDDDLSLAGRRVAGLHVFGDHRAIARAARSTGATALLITMPRAAGETVRRVFEIGARVGLEVRTVPPITDLLDGSLDASRIRQVRVEDLLRRPLAKDHTPAAKEVFGGRTVLITGAAGSIGAELARQVLALEPARIALVDQAESPLFYIERELRERVAQPRTVGQSRDVAISAHLVDITDAETVGRLFEGVRPHIVLHAAAYKHVPLLEEHPANAVETNIGGTAVLLDAAEAVEVERFVLVSTDKAVWPSSVMGASKRVAELLVADAARRLGRPWIAVRFGNVLGSNGSVVTIFQDQLERGQPLTITDPEMTRYFMTIPEASWLLLDATAIAEEGNLYVLDMGEPVRVMDIARDLARLAGRDPDSVPYTVVGLRRGEKLHEELFYDQESVQPTSVPKVLRGEMQEPPPHVREDIRGLLSLARRLDAVELGSVLHAYVRIAVESDPGLWGILETGALTSEPLGTRPAIIPPAAPAWAGAAAAVGSQPGRPMVGVPIVPDPGHASFGHALVAELGARAAAGARATSDASVARPAERPT
jgi:FlaA1/EpsC-like NDP-sugar epimerase